MHTIVKTIEDHMTIGKEYRGVKVLALAVTPEDQKIAHDATVLWVNIGKITVRNNDKGHSLWTRNY